MLTAVRVGMPRHQFAPCHYTFYKSIPRRIDDDARQIPTTRATKGFQPASFSKADHSTRCLGDIAGTIGIRYPLTDGGDGYLGQIAVPSGQDRGNGCDGIDACFEGCEVSWWGCAAGLRIVLGEEIAGGFIGHVRDGLSKSLHPSPPPPEVELRWGTLWCPISVLDNPLMLRCKRVLTSDPGSYLRVGLASRLLP
jgi:hypothetical protein